MSDGVTVVVKTIPTGGVLVTETNGAGLQKGTCATGWFSCSGGGCCPSGYGCAGAASCTVTASGASGTQASNSGVASADRYVKYEFTGMALMLCLGMLIF